jgi:hypothetical protein
MRNWVRKLEAMAAAVAFAEQGEWQAAQDIVQDGELKRASRVDELSKRPDRTARRPAYRV